MKLPRLTIPREVCTDPMEAIRREWLVTNGLGGFASGTVAGALTRRYHGLLVAALKPPLGRTLLVSKLDETVRVHGVERRLFTNIWTTGIEDPNACGCMQGFELVGGVPTWRFDVGGFSLTKRIWMEHRHNVTYVQYDLPADAETVELEARLLVNYRDYHYLVRPEGWTMDTASYGSGLIVRAFPEATPIHIRCDNLKSLNPQWDLSQVWHRDFYLPIEAERGFDHLEHHLHAATCRVELKPGSAATFVLATEADAGVMAHDALTRFERRAFARFDTWRSHTDAAVEPDAEALPTLALAAYQFIVRRATPDHPEGFTVIAGYPWFSDWGRDTMIALPGLTLTTGRTDIARSILLTWAQYVHEGLIPNRFPDEGDQPEYHTADATLWYLWAIDQYVRETNDLATLEKLMPVVQDIVRWHLRGTRHNIRVGDDGLVYAGHEGINLTWMDAKIGDRVITPRTGKPIELSALWYNAMCNVARWADALGQKPREYEDLAATTRASFQRFWDEPRRACFDVIDSPNGPDGRIQANQIFAVSLDHSPLAKQQQQAVVRAVEQKLLTPFGLRTLAPDEPGYRGHYAGGPVERDEAYHTGTVWGWLLGPYVVAHYRVHENRRYARSCLLPMFQHLRENGVGQIAEIFDGDPPHAPNGTPAQAWSVAETLRAWRMTQDSEE